MIEVKINITSFAQLAAVGTALATIEGVKLTPVAAPASTATITPQMQEAARQSVAEGTAAGAAGLAGSKPPKEPKADKPVKEVKAPAPAPEPAPAPSPAAETVTDAIVAGSTTTLPTYAESGLSELIAKAQLKDKDATVAVIRKHGGINDEGKTKGSSIPPANFAAAAADLGGILGEKLD